MSKSDTIARLIAEHPEMKNKQIAYLAGVSVEFVGTIRWRLKHAEWYAKYTREQQRNRYREQAAKGGQRPSDDEIIRAVRNMTFNQAAEHFGISRNVIAGAVWRSRRKQSRAVGRAVEEFTA